MKTAEMAVQAKDMFGKVLKCYCGGHLPVIFLTVFLLLSLSGCQASKSEPPSPAGPAATIVETENANSPDPTQPDIEENQPPSPEGADLPSGGTAEQTETAQAEVNNGEGSRDSGAAQEAVSLLITRNYGRQDLVERNIGLKAGWSILDVLRTSAEVTTKWDGGFVHGINGLNANAGGLTGISQDWFYYINGICADVGAFEYIMRAGEKVWWDYHAWGSAGLTNPAVVGCYPEPFVHGYRGQTGPTTVMSSAANSSQARAVQQALKAQGVAAVECTLLNDELLQNRPGPIIVLGTWEELKVLPWLDSFNKAYRKNGTGVHFTDDGVELMDGSGRVVRRSGSDTGIIAASAAGLGNYKVMWLLAGTDQDGLQNAVNILTARPGQLKGMYHLATISGQTLRLPLE